MLQLLALATAFLPFLAFAENYHCAGFEGQRIDFFENGSVRFTKDKSDITNSIFIFDDDKVNLIVVPANKNDYHDTNDKVLAELIANDMAGSYPGLVLAETANYKTAAFKMGTDSLLNVYTFYHNGLVIYSVNNSMHDLDGLVKDKLPYASNKTFWNECRVF